MNPQRDEELLRRYREASDGLDERPAASTRAAILAAAAREIGARPVDAAQTAPRPRTRWPWAAAAAVMLSTLAVLLATRTEQEQPSFTAPPEQERTGIPPPVEHAREPAREPAAPVGPAEPAAPSIAEGRPAAPAAESKRSAAAGSAAGTGRVQPTAPAPLRKENRQLAAAEEAPVARAKTESTAEADVADVRSRAPQAPPAAAAPQAPAPATAEAAAGRMGAAQVPGSEQQARVAERGPARADAGVSSGAMAAKPDASAADAAHEGERAGIEQRPEEWLQKIVRLRLDGRHDEADAELKRFRERYPQWQVPPAALAPSGTR